MHKQLQPELRFIGFTDAWEQRRLGDVAKKVTEKNVSLEYNEVFTNSAEHGIIHQSDFFDKAIANSNNIAGYYVVKPNDFIYNPRISTIAPFGPIRRNLLGITGVMSPLYFVFRTNKIDKQFLDAYFTTTYWHIFMQNNADTGVRSDRLSIKDSVLANLPICTPPGGAEQQSIGALFATLDKQITFQQRKCELFQDFKKTLLQKMFPQHDTLFPETRFTGFTTEWERRRLGDVTVIQNNMRIPITAQNRITGKTPYYGANGIQDYVDGYTHDGENVLIAEDGANSITDYPVTYTQGKIWVKGLLLVLVTVNLSPKLILHSLSSRSQTR